MLSNVLVRDSRRPTEWRSLSVDEAKIQNLHPTIYEELSANNIR